MNELLPDDIMTRLSPLLPEDEKFMQMALEEAKKGEFTTRPNPAVGCVIVKNNLIISSGFHPKAGYPHAEIFALTHAKNTGQDVSGATAYVTLEPCSHTGKTPPCADALIHLNIGRVVVATIDSNPKVAGQGIKKLLDAGIAVSLGVCQEQARSLNAGFLKAMAQGRPYVRLKMGISLDGRIAMKNGQSKWITSESSRADVQKLRAKSGAIITGSGTILKDNPRLSVRLPNLCFDNIGQITIPDPKIVVVDRSNRLKKSDDFIVFDNPDTLIWREDLDDLLHTLTQEYQCHDVLVEAGATLATAFLTQKLVDELIIYQAPCLLGATSRPMFNTEIEHLQDKLNFILINIERLDDDIKLTLRPSEIKPI